MRRDTPAPDVPLFGWTDFYEAFASALLRRRGDRAGVIALIDEVYGRFR
jgi:hypothetical protein